MENNYKLSLWEDIQQEDGSFIERKICNLGERNIPSPIKPYNVKLEEKTNGEYNLTFDIPLKYYNIQTGKIENNPFNYLLINERKIKLYKSDNKKWYHFILKNSQENTNNYINSWTAKSSLIQELSKNGYDIELDTELMNNMGTITQLGEKILEGSDWSVSSEVNLKEKQKEALYEVYTKKSINARGALDGKDYTIKQGEKIFLFYQEIENQESELQVIVESLGFINNYILYSKDDNNLLINVSFKPGESNYINNLVTEFILSPFKGERLIKKQKSIYDKILEQYVDIYKDNNNTEYYGYTKTEYYDSTLVTNLLANTKEAVNTNGWISYNNAKVDLIFDKENDKYYSKILLDYTKVTSTQNEGYAIYNTGPLANASIINNITKGEEFIFRYKLSDNSQKVNGILALYDIKNNNFTDKIISFTSQLFVEDDYIYMLGTATNSYSYKELIDYTKKLGFFIKPIDNKQIQILDAELFRKVINPTATGERKFLIPGEYVASLILTKYNYYNPLENSDIKTKDELKLFYSDYTPNSNLIPVYNTDLNNKYEKIRSINLKESNRYNGIMILAETFECWPRLEVETDESGAIIPGTKKVIFKEYIGKDNAAGFKFGINLNSITRVLNSDNLVTKIIVKNNSNIFAEDGFCSISRAKNNPTKENFIFNFDYYINKGILDINNVNIDLYGSENNNNKEGYYTFLARKNTIANELIKENTLLKVSEVRLIADVEYHSTSIESATMEIEKLKDTSYSICGLDFESMKNFEGWDGNEDIQLLLKQVETLESSRNKSVIFLNQKEEELEQIQNKIKENETTLELISKEKKEKNQEFFNKYYNYIQEGTWMSEDYYDDDLYYTDGLNTLYESAFPKVTYNFSVQALNGIEKYKNYKYEVGDKTFVIDTNYFGWVKIDGYKTPYKEEVIINSIITNLDDLTDVQISIQNYKKQFEELFQRVASTVQQLEYSGGDYNRAAEAILKDESIDESFIQNTIDNNSLIISNAKNQSVIQDDSGITIIDKLNPSSIVRLTNGAIAISTDSGATYTSAITGDGINTKLLTAGVINAGLIQIISGTSPAFRWNKNGITAYKTNSNKTFDYSNFIRLDQYGLYGIDNDSVTINGSEFAPRDIAEIEAKANFGLTWKGFFLNNNENTVKISSTDDFQVIKSGVERVKIGRIGNGQYGIKIKDSNANDIFYTDNNGNLTLKGNIYAAGGTIAGFTISGDSLIGSQVGMCGRSGQNYAFWAGGNTSADAPFRVGHDGGLRATNATISGTISGSTITGSTITGGSLNINNKFKVDSSGAMTASNATITGGSLNINNKFKIDSSGSITSTKGIIAGWEITENSLIATNYQPYWGTSTLNLDARLAVIRLNDKTEGGDYDYKSEFGAGTLSIERFLPGEEESKGMVAISSSLIQINYGFNNPVNQYLFLQPEAVSLENSEGASARLTILGVETSSDIRLKNTVNNIDQNMLNLWYKIDPKQFYYNGNNKMSFGLIANDIATYLEDNDININSYNLINKRNEYYSLNYNEYHMITAAVVKQLKQEVELLKQEINNLKLDKNN